MFEKIRRSFAALAVAGLASNTSSSFCNNGWFVGNEALDVQWTHIETLPSEINQSIMLFGYAVRCPDGSPYGSEESCLLYLDVDKGMALSDSQAQFYKSFKVGDLVYIPEGFQATARSLDNVAFVPKIKVQPGDETYAATNG